MRILHVVAGEKWTGVAAVVYDWTKALVEAGLEAQFAFVGGQSLARRILPVGWARPLLSRSHGLLGTLRDVPELRRTLAREAFDLVHVHASHDHYLAGLARHRGKTRPRLVRTIHHLRHTRPDWMMRRLFRSTDAFAFANLEIARAFGKGGPVHSPVVDTNVFRPGPRPAELPGIGSVPREGLVFGTVAKIAARRGHAEAITAAAPLPEAYLLHVGKGELRPALEAAAAAAGVAARNLWAGYQDETLPLFYRAMDAFLFTASGSQQGQRAILEAMASGVPVAALDLPGVRELVTDGVEGLVAKDMAALTTALERLRDDAALRGRMAGAARRRALQFSGPDFAALAKTFYASALSTTVSRGSPSGGTSATPSGAPARSSPADR